MILSLVISKTFFIIKNRNSYGSCLCIEYIYICNGKSVILELIGTKVYIGTRIYIGTRMYIGARIYIGARRFRITEMVMFK